MKVSTSTHQHITIEHNKAEMDEVHKFLTMSNWAVKRAGPKVEDFRAVPDTFLTVATRQLTDAKKSNKLPKL